MATTVEVNAQTVHLVEYVSAGMPEPSHFAVRTAPVTVAPLPEGAIHVKILAMSADPYLRGRIKPPSQGMPGAPPAALDLAAGRSTMQGYLAGKVVASNNENWVAGDLFGANADFSTEQVWTAEFLKRTQIWKLTGLISEEEISLGIGALGMPGATAYVGLIEILRPNQGETIFISGAAGAVGGLVGMIAKSIYNCRVIGSCGGPDKVALVKSAFGFDEAIDYKTTNTKEELQAALKAFAPDGIDMYFDNVGGIHFEAAFDSLKRFGRIAVCGQISHYNAEATRPTQFNPMQMVYNFQRIEGFVTGPWLSGARKSNHLQDMNQWRKEGKIRVQETVFEGIDNWAVGFRSLFTGGNTGKVVIRV